MKYFFLLLPVFLGSQLFSQVNRYDTPAEQPTNQSYYQMSDNTYEQLKSTLLAKQAQYDALKQKLEYVEQRVFDLKLMNNKKDLLFESELDGIQNKIDYLRDKDLTLYTREIEGFNPAINKAYLSFIDRNRAN